MRKIVSFVVKVLCIFAVMFSLSTITCLGANKGGNGDGDNNGGGTSETRPNGNTIPPIILRPR